MKNVWRLKTHHIHPGVALSWTRQNGIIAVGWGLTDDLRKLVCNSPADIRAVIRQKYPMARNCAIGGNSLWNLWREVQEKDLVILSGDKTRELVVEVTGEYFFAEQAPSINGIDLGDFFHQCRVSVVDRNPEELWRQAGGMLQGQSVYQTLIRCSKPVE